MHFMCGRRSVVDPFIEVEDNKMPILQGPSRLTAALGLATLSSVPVDLPAPLNRPPSR